MFITSISYLLFSVILTSYFPEVANVSVVSTPCIICLAYQLIAWEHGPVKTFGDEFWVEELGSDGSSVAAYLRVSTSRQAKEGLSLEVQRDRLNNMKERFKPSKIYWFVDAGVSGEEDFDRRKVKRILELREKGEISELWVTHLDRIGRECEDSLFFFLKFCKGGGLIRTPDRTYSSEDLGGIIMYVVESYCAESENKRRAERANASKIRNFRSRKWNKPVPLGYCKDGDWIRKVNGHAPLIQEIFTLFIQHKSCSVVARKINEKYGKVLGKHLTNDSVKRILCNPVYIGHPSFMGESVVDESLRYVSDTIFNSCLSKLSGGNSKKALRTSEKSTIMKLAQAYDYSLLDFLEEIAELHHRGCGGSLLKNGTRFQGLIMQQAYKCSKCGAQFRIPTKKMLEKISEQKEDQLKSIPSETPQKPLKKWVQSSLVKYIEISDI